jgi:2-oxoglutarate ferredoxin oxidoreductase subunit beta
MSDGAGGLALVPHSREPQSVKDFKSDQEVRWCPGCGDYAILAAVQSFLPELGLQRENIVFISGIGCSSRFPYYLKTYGMHSIHGRAPAIATGLASSRPDLSVWVVTGDGDALSIGGNHLIHALRRNVNLKILLFNNRIYGLTKGQYSPTSELGKVTKSTPFGSLDQPFNPVSLALGAEATFVARTIDSDRKHLQSVLRAAAEHRGTAFVEILQNCNIYNDGAFDLLKEPATRDEVVVRLEQDQPVRFGAGGAKGVRLNGRGGLEVVAVTEENVDSLHVHDAHADQPAVAFMLSRLGNVDWGVTPIGVFRDVHRGTYDDLMREQIEHAVAEQGPGDLAALLSGGDTWRIG